ncbi:MAG: manganese-binding transcriptional regulator MntR [Phycisphaerales bacterium]|nr:manganese-binding transcriptional regulator MntR [Phycisphaerales bacterium]
MPPSTPKPTRKHDDSERFRGTRAAHKDETAEDYVEAVAQLIEARGEARVRDLAAMMGVSHVTVTRIVARLVRDGLLVTEPYRPVALTPKGRRLAAHARERHADVLAFLTALGVPRRQAQIDAEGIEHHVSEATIRAMRAVARRGGPAPGS